MTSDVLLHSKIHFHEVCIGIMHRDATAVQRKQCIHLPSFCSSHVSMFILQSRLAPSLAQFQPLGLEPLVLVGLKPYFTLFLIRPLKTRVLHLSLVNMHKRWCVLPNKKGGGGGNKYQQRFCTKCAAKQQNLYSSACKGSFQILRWICVFIYLILIYSTQRLIYNFLFSHTSNIAYNVGRYTV